jgi:hypothetical protein
MADLERWLRVQMPALYRRHAGQPWIKDLLRARVHVGSVA